MEHWGLCKHPRGFQVPGGHYSLQLRDHTAGSVAVDSQCAINKAEKERAFRGPLPPAWQANTWALGIWQGMVPSSRCHWKRSGGKQVRLHHPPLRLVTESLGILALRIIRLRQELGWTVKFPTVYQTGDLLRDRAKAGVEESQWIKIFFSYGREHIEKKKII